MTDNMVECKISNDDYFTKRQWEEIERIIGKVNTNINYEIKIDNKDVFEKVFKRRGNI